MAVYEKSPDVEITIKDLLGAIGAKYLCKFFVKILDR